MMYSKYAINKLVDAALRGGTLTFPSTYYVALLVSAPTAADVYQEIGNVNPRGYARYTITANATNWSATNGPGTTTNPSTGELGSTLKTFSSSNNAAIVFPNPTGHWTYGSGAGPTEITHIALFDSATIGAGNLWFYCPIGRKKISATDTAPTIPLGALKFTFDR